jgi:hypothetical protein
MTTKNQLTEREEIESLLPWHAAGTLGRRDAQKVERALAADQDLARNYAAVREELVETIRLNETLGAPSARAMQRLMADIEADAATARRSRSSFDLSVWLAEKLSTFSPRMLAWSAAAATLAIVLQAGLLAGIFMNERASQQGGFQTASFSTEAPKAEGTYALVSFAPQVSATEITKFLEAHKFSMAEGPRAGGLYKVRLSVTGLPKEELSRIVKRLQDDTSVVRFVAPVD